MAASARDEVEEADDPPRVRVVEDFEVFFRREQRGLVALAFALTGSRGAAEDIAQEALVAASRRWGHVSQLDSPIGWTRRVVANRSTSLIRRRASEARAKARLALRGGPTEPAPSMASENEHLWALVRRLPKRQAQVIALRAVHGLSLREVADTIGISKATAQTHLERARATLAHQLEEGEDR
ncbi:MAG: sigma-70 family RNA polymerase sigma factor [Actinomycetota bacterium]|nr:sigma-70 family RNA polymerase sigma factor [Actinomycetota bacterium]